MSIEVKNISKSFNSFKALDDVSLDVKTGELLALLGPSGSGKTTLLRLIAGLEAPDSGEIFFHGEEAKEKKTKDRNVGFVFQHYALFRHMTVFENIAFGLRVKPKTIRPTKEQIKEKVHGLLRLVQLDLVADRYPSQLSGGQRQRIALARALAIEPKVLLLDEPFGSLDAKVRKELRHWLRRFHDDLHITTVFVTHDQEEALEVADKIVIMNQGKIEQIGSPEEVYHHPASIFILNFLGNVNLFHARVEKGKTVLGDAPARDNVKTTKVYIRPHQLDIKKEAANEQSIRAKILYINATGSIVKVELKADHGDLIQVEIPHERYQELSLKKDDIVFVTPKDINFFKDDYSI